MCFGFGANRSQNTLCSDHTAKAYFKFLLLLIWVRGSRTLRNRLYYSTLFARLSRGERGIWDKFGQNWGQIWGEWGVGSGEWGVGSGIFGAVWAGLGQWAIVARASRPCHLPSPQAESERSHYRGMGSREMPEFPSSFSPHPQPLSHRERGVGSLPLLVRELTARQFFVLVPEVGFCWAGQTRGSAPTGKAIW